VNPDKLHPSFQDPSFQVVAKGLEGFPVIVRYRPAVVKDWAVQRDLEVKHTYQLVPAVATRVTQARLEELTDDPDVELIWPDLEVHTMLDESVPIIRAPLVWEAGDTGQGVKVAIVDTGIDPEHPDFAGRIVIVTDFTGEGAADNNGHGTHVAGIIAGSGAASDGKYRGVAPGASLMAAKVLKGSGSGLMSDVMAGVEWAVQQGAQVINLSLGGPPTPCNGTDALSATCDAAVEAGVVVCVAAGNSGPRERTIGSPGCARQVITVGATVSGPTDYDSIADFSSRGPTSDGRVKPDVAMPGVDIVSARAHGTSMGTPVNDFYTQASGTSMATPHASGVAALVLQKEPSLTPAQVKERMMRAGRDMGLDPNTQGSGRVDAYDAYLGEAGEPLPPPPGPPPPPPPPPPGSGCLPVLVMLPWMLFRR
jgi:serine protease AprX